MNIFTLISFARSIVVLFVGLYLSSPNLGLFVDKTSMFIVVGGSLAATAISFRLNRLFVLTKVFLGRVLKDSEPNYKGLVSEIILVVDQIKKGSSISTLAESSTDHFLKETLLLIQDGLLARDELIEVLELRNLKLAASYKTDTDKMKAIGKYPPAFGMIGTTIGMIVLLANLGGEDAMKMIGPAMGVCLITTLYGAAIANIIINPMAANLNEGTKETYAKNEIIIEGAKLIIDKKSPILAAERLNSFLNPSQRVDWKELLKK
jgi:chemotaxis protein MotA